MALKCVGNGSKMKKANSVCFPVMKTKAFAAKIRQIYRCCQDEKRSWPYWIFTRLNTHFIRITTVCGTANNTIIYSRYRCNFVHIFHFFTSFALLFFVHFVRKFNCVVIERRRKRFLLNLWNSHRENAVSHMIEKRKEWRFVNGQMSWLRSIGFIEHHKRHIIDELLFIRQ